MAKCFESPYSSFLSKTSLESCDTVTPFSFTVHCSEWHLVFGRNFLTKHDQTIPSFDWSPWWHLPISLLFTKWPCGCLFACSHGRVPQDLVVCNITSSEGRPTKHPTSIQPKSLKSVSWLNRMMLSTINLEGGRGKSHHVVHVALEKKE